MDVLCSTLSVLSSGLCGIVYFPCNTGHPLNMLNIVESGIKHHNPIPTTKDEKTLISNPPHYLYLI
jgi:hypothetical protein